MADVPVMVGPRLEIQPFRPFGGEVPTAADAFGYGAYSGLASAGHDLTELILEEKRKESGARLTDAMSQFTDGAFGLLNDPQNGLLNKKGKEAEGITQQATAGLQKIGSDVENGLKTDAEKQIFREAARRQIEAHRNDAAGHEAREVENYRDFSAQEFLDATERIGAANPANGQLHMDNVDHIRAAIKTRFGDRVTPEQLDGLQKKAVSNYYSGVIAAIPEQQAALARGIYQAHRDDIDPDARRKLEAGFQTYATRSTAQTKADELWKTTQGDLGKALDGAATIDDVELRDETERRIRQHASDADEARQSTDRAAFNAADAAFRQNGNHAKSIPSAVWAQLDSQKRRYFADEEERTYNPKGGPVDLEAWADWTTLSDADKAKADVVKTLSGKVPSTLITRALGEQAEAKRRVDNAEAKSVPLTETMKSRELQSAILGTGTDPATPKGKRKLGALAIWLEPQIADLEGQSGKRINVGELRDLLAKGLVKGTRTEKILGIDWLAPDQTVYRYEVQPGQEFTPDPSLSPAQQDALRQAVGARVGQLTGAGTPSSTPEIPAEDRKQIEEALSAAGRPVTDDLVRAIWQKKQQLSGAMR